MDSNEIARLLHRVLEVIDSTEPGSGLDSGADSIDLLLELEEEIRDTVCDITGTYPQRPKEFDPSADIQLQSEG